MPIIDFANRLLIKYASELTPQKSIWDFFKPKNDDVNDAADKAWQAKLATVDSATRKQLEADKWAELKSLAVKFSGGSVDHSLMQAVSRAGTARDGVNAWQEAGEFLTELNKIIEIYKVPVGSKWEYECSGNLIAVYEKMGNRFIQKTFLLPSDTKTGSSGPIRKELERILPKHRR